MESFEVFQQSIFLKKSIRATLRYKACENIYFPGDSEKVSKFYQRFFVFLMVTSVLYKNSRHNIQISNFCICNTKVQNRD